MYQLADLGFSSFFQEQLQNADSTVARIAAEHRGGYEVWSNAGKGLARLSGRLMRDLAGEDLPGVGDWVTLRSKPEPKSVSIIDTVLTRRTVFVRGAAGREMRGQVIAANVDVVFAVCGLDDDYNVRRIERYLARIWASGAQPVVILNKADICNDVATRVDDVTRSCIDVPVLVASALLSDGSSDGVTAIRNHLSNGTTAAFVGSSGVGKSTLINALLGEHRMATQAIRARDGRGCHTTTHRQLILLPNSGLLIDTPGMRELQLVDEEGISAVFADIETIAAECRFRDCSHQSEPGCAVRRAIDAGNIRANRLDHYLKMEAEACAYEIRHDERLRRESDRALGRQYARDGKLLRRLKQRTG